MGIQLTKTDSDQLRGILEATPEWRTERGRIAFIDDLFEGSPRKADIVYRIDLGSTPRQTAGELIRFLTQFGQDEPGQETLGILINKLLSYTGGGQDADFLRGLFARYPLTGDPVLTRGLSQWPVAAGLREYKELAFAPETMHHVRILDAAQQAARAVVRIKPPTGIGTGFLVGERLIMTCNHVIGDRPTARESTFTFNYQLDRHDRLPEPLPIATAQADGLFHANPDLDYAVIEAVAVPAEVAAQPLTLAPLRVEREQRVNIIQHPGGHFKKIAMQKNFVAHADARDVYYMTSTEPGSSGSPVLDNGFVVVAVHTGSTPVADPETGDYYVRNHGSSMIAVLNDLHHNAPRIYEQLTIA